MTELVREDAEAAVLGLGGVVTQPDAGVADLDTTELGAVGTLRAAGVRRPAVRPDRPLGSAGLLAGSGVDGLEVVDVAVRLVEVAVAVVVVAVPHVEGLQVGLDLGRRLALRLLRLEPGLAAVVDEAGHVGVVLGLPVAGLVVRDRDPVADVALDVEATAGHLLVDAVEGLAVLLGHAVEEHVEVVLAVEVRLPVGAVVLAAVRLRDLAARRAGRRGREAGVLRVTEVDQERQDLRVLLGAVLDPLLLADLDRLGAAALLGLGLAGGDLLDRLLAQLTPLGLARVRTVVGLGLGRRLLAVAAGHGRRRLRRAGYDGGDEREGRGRPEDACDASVHEDPP